MGTWRHLLDTPTTKKYIHEVGTLIMQELATRKTERDSSLSEPASFNHKLDMELIDKQVLIQNQNNMIDKLRQQCRVMILDKEDDTIVIDSLLTDKLNLQDLIDYQKGHIITCQENEKSVTPAIKDFISGK